MIHSTIYRCQDYVEIIRGSFGVTEVCGNTLSTDAVQELEFGNYTVVFRTSEEVRGEGFEMYSICFRPEEKDLPSMKIKLIHITLCMHMNAVLHNWWNWGEEMKAQIRILSYKSTCK